MLKLLRLEETCVFAIVDDEQFESEMDILGYVRMNYKEGLHYTKVFDDHKEDWFEELNRSINEKAKSLTMDVEYVKRVLNLENIVIQYLRIKRVRSVKISVIKKLVLYLFSEIRNRGLLFNFTDYYQLHDEKIEKHLQGSKHLSINGENICIKDYLCDIICFNPNTDVDFRIKQMIREFVAKDKKVI